MQKKKNKNAQSLGKLGGSVTSEAKKLSSRENGRKGGKKRIVSHESEKLEDIKLDTVQDAEDTQAEDQEEAPPEWE